MRKAIEHNNFKKIIIFLRENRKIALALLTVFIFVDIFFIRASSDIVIFSILFLYAIFIKMFQITSRRTFLLCLALLAAMFISFLFVGTAVSTEKGAVWLYLFLIIGVIQKWRE